MMINLRSACSGDYAFALNLYVEAIKPLAANWMDRIDDQRAQFAGLWRPHDTYIITFNGKDIGSVEFRQTGDETFLKQLYITPAYQRQGIGSQVMRLLEDRCWTAKSMALFVLKNNPAFPFYKRHGFDVVQEMPTIFVMRREMVEGGSILPLRRRS